MIESIHALHNASLTAVTLMGASFVLGAASVIAALVFLERVRRGLKE